LGNKMIGRNSENINENLILRRALYKKDRNALAFLHAKYHSRMKQYIAYRVNSATDAEDLTQDVFVELCKGNGCYDGHGNVEGYLFGIARNIVRRYLRDRANSIKTVRVDSISNLAVRGNIQQHTEPAGQIEEEELNKAIEDVVTQLPPKAREAIRLRFIEGLSSKEAAEKAGCSLYTFYKRLQRVMKTLQQIREKEKQSGIQDTLNS
jgi:RNA polymerase sigma-70 factor (ECF subfamily)